MNEKIVEQFERQIDSLLREFDRQKGDNFKLRDKQSNLLDECDALKEKLKLAILTIKKTLKRLKAIERENEYQ